MFRSAITNSIKVEVLPRYEDIPATGSQSRFIFTYTIKITNLGGQSCRLISRKWQITNALAEHKWVEGPGVVGEQPLIGPGQTYIYSSVCPLNSEIGRMQGHYHFHCDESDDVFLVQIPPFVLEATFKLN
jgi:ApaG protein